jgi:tRNA G10  N-methylase Trm11
VDFDKPARSMQTGMMPAKLTHSLINIAIAYNKKADLIFDPFCGTGTTGFIANAFDYNFIGSDIKLNLAVTNEPRWKQTKYFQDRIFSFYEQDISKPLDAKRFEAVLKNNSLIVTEGRLGPVIKQTTTPVEIQEYQRRVKNLYLQFIQTITDFFPKDKKPVMVFTIPEYIGQENSIEEQISTLSAQLGRKMETLDEVYKRENQKV